VRAGVTKLTARTSLAETRLVAATHEVRPHPGHVRAPLRVGFWSAVTGCAGRGAGENAQHEGHVPRDVTKSAGADAYFLTWTVLSEKPPPDVTCAVIVVSDGLLLAGVTVSWLLWLPPALIVTGDGDTV
jgi:hypothetical protein